MDKAQAKRLAWETGRLRYLLDPTQRRLYDEFRGAERNRAIHFWNCSRQLGKSYTLCVLALEECLRTPLAQVKYASQDQKSARAIVFPQMDLLLQDCPDELMPRFRPQDGLYYFPHNGARLTIAGAEKSHVRKLRGQRANLIIVDEGAFIDELERLLFSVLYPQTTTTRGNLLVATTPAESAGHYSTHLAQLCKSDGRYQKRTIWDSCRISEAEKLEIMDGYGGEQSTRFRREYLCEFVTDAENAVVPEFDEKAEAELVRPIEPPEYFDAYTALDGGFTDAAGAVFGFADYKTATLSIQRDWAERGALGSEIAEDVGQIENELWRDYAEKFHTIRVEQRPKIPHLRVMDVDPRLAAEFLRNHGQAWQPFEKQPGYKQAVVNRFNDFIRQRRLRIDPSCKTLIRQLHNATWAVNRKSFKRDSVDAHYDVLDAAVGLLERVDFSHNPWPPPPANLATNYFTQDEVHRRGLSETEQTLADAFGLERLRVV